MKSTNKKFFTSGLFIMGALFVVVCAAFALRIIQIQNSDEDRFAFIGEKTYERREVIQAVRGEIYDRNGKPLVTNEYTNTIELSYNALKTVTPNGRNQIIANLYSVLADHKENFETRFPVVGTYPHVQYDTAALESTVTKNRFNAFLKSHGLKADIECVELFEWLLDYYGIRKNNKYVYEGDTQYAVVAVRYELDTMNFSPDNPFVVKRKADIRFVTSVLERAYTGIYIEKEWERVYNYPGYASHILGRVGMIPEDQIDEYLKLGYSYDAKVGVDGAEKAFEQLLRGADGVQVFVENEFGTVISSYVEKEPVAGKNVFLTIDIDLQIDAEKLLAENIKSIVQNAKNENDGAKADSGAVSAIDPNTGQVLALASYPTFDLSTFADDYAALSSDKSRPLFNRALLGNYAPGSTFKIATSAAALTHGTVSPYTEVYCAGRYDYYSDYKPRCWNTSGHGSLAMRDAIGVSCNCYFFDIGRRMGIDVLNEYCASLGLGEYTGIELTESQGVIAGPAYYEQAELGAWNPGDTLQASIGQSGNAVTPLQLSSYISAVLNSGVRYKATILYKTETFSGKDEMYSQPEVIGQAELSDDHRRILKEGMKRSKEMTSATKRYKFPIGSKTGTAQISNTENNAVLTAFAPYDNPQIVVSCVIENGAAGGYTAPTVLGTISSYFDLDKDGNPLQEE